MMRASGKDAIDRGAELRALLERALDRVFRGEVSGWSYALMRIGLAAILLVRHSDWLAPWIPLEHHLWVKGLDFLWSIPRTPHLVSPLVRGLVLGETATLWLVYARTALAVLLLFGIRARTTALLLALMSYVLLLSDRYRYFHHLHLLYLSIAWLSLCPIGDRLNLERTLCRAWAALRRRAPATFCFPPPSSPIWPLQLVRVFVMGVYFAAGVAKLDPAWTSGETLELLERFHVLGGASFSLVRGWLGYAALAKLICVIELLLPVCLALRVTRRWAIAAALAFHASISASMMVSTFGVQMAVLLLAFWPDRLDAEGGCARLQSREEYRAWS